MATLSAAQHNPGSGYSAHPRVNWTTQRDTRRMVGTVQAKAEGWMDRDALNAQVSAVRDSAAELLGHLGGGATPASPRTAKQPARSAAAGSQSPRRGAASKRQGAKSSNARSATVKPAAATRNASAGRSGGVVDAPGKRHRKPAANEAMPKPNDARMARLKVANANANRGRGRG